LQSYVSFKGRNEVSLLLDVWVEATLGFVLSVRNRVTKLWLGLSHLAVSCHLFLLVGKTSRKLKEVCLKAFIRFAGKPSQLCQV
jgi:hypothetical protein